MPQLKEFITHVTGAQLVMPDGLENDQASILQKEFDGISTDTRTLSPGAIFIGLSGPRFDGAAFLQAAQDRGARAAVLSATAAHRLGVRLPLILVPDALGALLPASTVMRSAAGAETTRACTCTAHAKPSMPSSLLRVSQ